MKRYVHEADSQAVRRHLRQGPIATSRFSEVEIASALARRQRQGGFTATERDRAFTSLNRDLAAWILVEMTPQLTREAQSLLLRHELRPGDAVQLASVLHLQREIGEPLRFAAFDDRLNAAAAREGLELLDLR